MQTGGPGIPASTGYVLVLSGATGGVLWTLVGSAVGEHFGRELAGTDDLNGDGDPAPGPLPGVMTPGLAVLLL